MRNRLYTFFLCLITLFAGCTRGLWLDEVVAQRDEQEEVVPILRAAQEKGLTVDSVEEIERTNKYYTADTANGYYNEFKRYRLVFSDQTIVEFDVLGTLNGVQSEYYEKRDLFYISEISLSSGNYVSIDLLNPAGGGYEWRISFPITATLDDPNDNPNTPKIRKIYYTSTDGGVVTPNDAGAFGANIVSNTYENGQGVITFDRDVTTIGHSAFIECSTLAEITIPEGVTSIGSYAFYACSGLASITIPEGVTSIGHMAFGYCSSLASITIPDSVTSIGEDAFSGCSSLAEFKGKFASEDGRCLIADGVLHFFTPAAGLTEYVIPNGVTTIGERAFYECDELVSVTIPDGVTSIKDDAFRWCDNLASINIPEGVTEIGDYAFGITKLTSVTLPESLTSLGYIAFAYCRSLKEVYCKATTPPTAIPDSSYGWGAFDSNASDRTIYVPEESVEAYKTAEWWSEYSDAFVPYNFLKNQKIYYTSTDGNVVTPYATDVFGANIVSNTYENGQGVITFDGEVTTIGEYAFHNCSSLASITIPDSVTSIGNYAFWYCSSLANITIPEGVTSIGKSAFYYCSSLASITIPEGVTTIGGYAFEYCSSLASITIPDSVTSIGNSAFSGCTSLASITIPDSVTSIGNSAFSGCTGLTSITIPESVTSIGDYAFYQCSNLASVVIPEGVASIGGSTFQSCTSLASITIPDSVTSIGDKAFTGCLNLTEFSGKFASEDGRCLIVDGVINSFAIGCGLTEYTIPDSVTSIGDSAFWCCTSLASITIPDSVTSIGYYAFGYCSSLTSITIPDSVTSIGDCAFYACSSLASTTIPESVTSIGIYAFYNCTSLASITIPESVTSIGIYAFYNCTSLASVYCKPTTPPSGSSSMFDDNASGRKIYVPEESVEAYKTAEWWGDYADAFVGYSF